MISELELLSKTPVTALSVVQSLHLLEKISTQLRGKISDNQRERIYVPDRSGLLRQIDDVYYDDLNRSETTRMLSFGTPAHPNLSKALASGITLRFLSSLELGEDGEDDEDDVDDMDMGEDLCTRIAGILKDHDINYALNEFLANAADARASQFSMLLDTQSFECTTVLSPEMAKFQQGPSLILHNDAKFTEKDFLGLRKIGLGGKAADPDTIGRFGLGALSLFHFTEVCLLGIERTGAITCLAQMPMLISGRYIMILDPSGMYLPPRKGRRRTALRRTLCSLARSAIFYFALEARLNDKQQISGSNFRVRIFVWVLYL